MIHNHLMKSSKTYAIISIVCLAAQIGFVKYAGKQMSK